MPHILYLLSSRFSSHDIVDILVAVKCGFGGRVDNMLEVIFTGWARRGAARGFG